MSLIHNERTKLLATTANNVGTATIVAGVVTTIEGMTWLQLYVLVGIPMILLALGYGAMKLADHDRRVLDRKTQDH